MPPLTALLSLLTNLSYTLPSFSSFLLCPSEDGPPRILAILCDVVRQRMAPQQTSDAGKFRALAECVIGLLESLCWNIPEDLEQQYVPLLFTEAWLMQFVTAWDMYLAVRRF